MVSAPQGGLSKGPCQLSPSPYSGLTWDDSFYPHCPLEFVTQAAEEKVVLCLVWYLLVRSFVRCVMV